MERIAYAGSNTDFCYVRLPSFDNFNPDGKPLTPCYIQLPDETYVSLTVPNLSEEWMDENEETEGRSMTDYFLVANLSGCDAAERTKRRREMSRVLRRIRNMNALKKTKVHPQFHDNGDLYKEAVIEEKGEESAFIDFCIEHDLAQHLKAYITKVSIPYLTISGGVSSLVRRVVADKGLSLKDALANYDITPPKELPWPDGCWVDGEEPPVRPILPRKTLAEVILESIKEKTPSKFEISQAKSILRGL